MLDTIKSNNSSVVADGVIAPTTSLANNNIIY